ncbi:MAG: M56 family metallopeptidase, partial [Sneathiella sp.]|nr:M56 family metallopeptidase [Sneathiella sp.]
MVIYILKFSACLALFLAFYKLFLEKENMHAFKRFYLLSALFLAIGIPLVTFTYYVEPIAQVLPLVIQEIPVDYSTGLVAPETNYLPIILWSIYSLGVMIFGFKFIRNLYGISYKIKHNPKQKTNRITNVLLQDLIVPHTFFNFIFFNKQKFEAQEIPKEVLLHEETHAKQKHSIDVLIIETIQVLLWFNPLIYLYKHLIKLNHEFLADQGVLNKGVNTINYQKTILAFSSPDSYRNAKQPQLANAINYSLIKKRFPVMKTQTSKKAIWLRSLVLLPLLAITLYSFSDTVIIERESNKLKSLEVIKLQEEVSEKNNIYKNLKKEMLIMININSVSINAKPSSLKTFKNDLNSITKNWEETD